MNRYVIAGATADAQAGKSVIISCRHAARHLDSVADSGGVEKVFRANGQERVDFQSGGSVRLISGNRAALRGHSADVVFLDHDGADRIEDALPVVSASGGEVIRA